MSDALKIGIAGLGTVGVGLVKMLKKNKTATFAKAGRELTLVGVCARSREKDRGVNLDEVTWHDDAVALANAPDVDLFVELIGGEDGPALVSVKAALNNGKSVVTANKAMMAKHGVELAQLAEDKGVSLNYEAAIAGGIPIVKTLRESLAGNDIRRISGILNGTCNYILTVMEDEGRSFVDVLKEAQDKGYAEADPSFDIGGIDAAHKLALLASLGFGVRPSFDDIYIEGIEEISAEDISAADTLGYRIKLLGVVTRSANGIEQRVHPTMVKKNSNIASVNGVTNCVHVEGDFAGDVLLVGPGAGEGATASSVMSDVIDIARNIQVPTFGRPVTDLKQLEKAPLLAHAGGYYVRLNLTDKIGSFASVAQRMAEQGISLESIVQMSEEDAPSQSMPVIIITHETTEQAIHKACQAIENDGHVVGSPKLIRIET